MKEMVFIRIVIVWKKVFDFFNKKNTVTCYVLFVFSKKLRFKSELHLKIRPIFSATIS